MKYTTLNAIRAKHPCRAGWALLLGGLGKTEADDEPLALIRILDINGLDDALWALRALEDSDREVRLLAVAFARKVQHLMRDERSLRALDVAERFAHGSATLEELRQARADAADAYAADADAYAADAAAAAAYAAYAAYADAAYAADADAAYAADADAYAADAAADAAYAAYAADAADARAEMCTQQEQLFRDMFG